MSNIPREKWPDSSLALLADPYRFISKRSRLFRSDVFETRLSMRRTLCLTGQDAATLFYDESRFARAGVAPSWLKKTLLGEGAVQGLDGEAHRHRKALFLSLMSPERLEQLFAAMEARWADAARRWAGLDRIVLYEQAQQLLAQSVLEWSGVPVEEAGLDRWTRELTAMFDQAAGPGHLWSRRARRRAERRIGTLIEKIRGGRYHPEPATAAAVVAWHHDHGGRLLDVHTAAVELINVLRPTVAVSVYVVFVALALHDYPDCRDRLRTDGSAYVEAFVQEVRRFYPFFPAVMARVRQEFEWKGYRFPAGRRALLDLYGTNHDARAWNQPDEFRPERFLGWSPDPYRLVPQGGGVPHRHHRCPGEAIVIGMMKVAAEFLAHLEYDVPAQDLRIRWARLPALPRSRFVIENVRAPLAGAAAAGDRAVHPRR